MRNKATPKSEAIDYQRAFQDAPVGQALGRDRLIVACNRAFAAIFRAQVDELIGTSFERLYPSSKQVIASARCSPGTTLSPTTA
jgi:PAS domain-containing protein